MELKPATRSEARRLLVSFAAIVPLIGVGAFVPTVGVLTLVAIVVFWATVLRIASRETGQAMRVVAGWPVWRQSREQRRSAVRVVLTTMDPAWNARVARATEWPYRVVMVAQGVAFAAGLALMVASWL